MNLVFLTHLLGPIQLSIDWSSCSDIIFRLSCLETLKCELSSSPKNWPGDRSALLLQLS